MDNFLITAGYVLLGVAVLVVNSLLLNGDKAVYGVAIGIMSFGPVAYQHGLQTPVPPPALPPDTKTTQIQTTETRETKETNQGSEGR